MSAKSESKTARKFSLSSSARISRSIPVGGKVAEGFGGGKCGFTSNRQALRAGRDQNGDSF
jgi:hypothetical protein